MKKSLIVILLIVIVFVVQLVLRSQEREYIGDYTYGADAETFVDINTKQLYWVIGEDSLLDNLHKKIEEMRKETSEPYPLLRIKVNGKDKGEAVNGLAEEGDRVLEIKKYEILE